MGEAVEVKGAAEQFEAWIAGQMRVDEEVTPRIIAMLLTAIQENQELRQFNSKLLAQLEGLGQSLTDARNTLYNLTKERK